MHNWHRDPTRTFEMLPRLIARLPALGEVVVEGQPILGTIEANPDRMEDELAAMTRLANKNRGSREKGEAVRDTNVALEQRIRRNIRRLLDARRSYVGERRRYELASRLIDQVLERLIAPPAGGTHGASPVRRGQDRNRRTARPIGPGSRKPRTGWSAFGPRSKRSGWHSTATSAACLTTIGNPCSMT